MWTLERKMTLKTEKKTRQEGTNAHEHTHTHAFLFLCQTPLSIYVNLFRAP